MSRIRDSDAEPGNGEWPLQALERGDRASGPGLSQAEAALRTNEGLSNTTPPSPGRSIWEITRANLFTRFNAILGSLFCVVIFVGPPQDGLFGLVIAINSAIGVTQEVRAKRALDRLSILTSPMSSVRRDGLDLRIAPQSIVLGDTVILRPGDQAPVDGIILESKALELDESQLTGESITVGKAVGDEVLSGTAVVSGSGVMQAIRVGAKSYAADLEARAKRFSLINSQLQQGTNRILKLITWVIIPIGPVLLLSELVRSHQSLPDSLRGSVAGISAMVPEGLVLLTSIAFAAGALRLSRLGVLVQELAAIEGLARVDIVCIDKTGTITTGEMTPTSLTPLGQHTSEELHNAIGAVGAMDASPNQTMKALASAYQKPEGWANGTSVPFSSEWKWSGTYFTGRGSWVIGAPEVVSPAIMSDATSPIAAQQAAGRRVLVIAHSPRGFPSRVNERPVLPAELEPAGFAVLEERIREDAGQTIDFLQSQGVRIKVLSGDSYATVGAIADSAGLQDSTKALDASALSQEELCARAGEVSVFGRIRPEQKKQVVEALQSAGHTVAMIGDGVNDIQALKQADLGIAMGSGSASSRAVARIVLLNNSFATVPQIVLEGRRVIANIERVAKLFVTKTVYAALLAIVVGITAVPYPFYPRHMTIVSTFTIGVPGFFLAFGKSAPMAQPDFLRRVAFFTIPAGTLAACATYLTYASARIAPHVSQEQSRTASLISLFLFGILVLTVVSRPLSFFKVGLVVAMGASAIPLLIWNGVNGFLSVSLPPVPITMAAAGASILAFLVLVAWMKAILVLPRVRTFLDRAISRS